MFPYLDSASACARDALRRRVSELPEDPGFVELARHHHLDGHAVACRGDVEHGEPAWSITIFGLALLAELLALDGVADCLAQGGL